MKFINEHDLINDKSPKHEANRRSRLIDKLNLLSVKKVKKEEI